VHAARPSAGSKSVYRWAGYQRREGPFERLFDISAGTPSCVKRTLSADHSDQEIVFRCREFVIQVKAREANHGLASVFICGRTMLAGGEPAAEGRVKRHS